MTFADWVILILFVVSLFWGIDRHLELKDIEKDMRLYLRDLESARNLAEGQIKVHYQATVAAAKTLIRKHFKI